MTIHHNKVSVIGNLTITPTLKNNGKIKNTLFYIASNREFVLDNGNIVKETDFIPIKAWGKTAESACKNLTVGRLVLIEGRVSARNYKDMEGKNKTSFNIIAERIVYLPTGAGKSYTKEPTQEEYSEEIPEDYDG